MLTVLDCFRAHHRRLIDKWSHYLPIYQRHFAPYVGTECRILEIGVSHGGSLQLWKSYLGPKAQIVGIDIDPRCKGWEEDQIEIHIMGQANPKIGELGDFDIVIDDGSHAITDQEASFRHLWPKTKGVYLIEDCHQGYPKIDVWKDEGFVYTYNWVLVFERPKRLIRGFPSRELRQDEIDAINLHTDS